MTTATSPTTAERLVAELRTLTESEQDESAREMTDEQTDRWVRLAEARLIGWPTSALTEIEGF